MTFRSLLTLAPWLLALAVPARADLLWKGKAVDPKAPPADLPAAVLEAAAPWQAWSQRRGYHLWVSDAGDCVLLAEKRFSGVAECLDLCRATIEFVDGFLSPRAPDAPSAEPRTPETGGGSLEDFELPPPGTPGPSEVPRRPHQVPVLFAARNPAHYKEGLGLLAQGNVWLSAWADEIGQHAYGLTLPQPLVGAWLIEAPENEEWDPRNELVHRLAQLLLMDRAGNLPYWMTVGTAWNAELAVRGGIYCFPYRTGFVGIGEHGGWAAALRARFGERNAGEVDAAVLCALQRGLYVDAYAATAWGGMRYLLAEHRAALPGLFADLDLVWRQGALEVSADGSWRSRPQWEWPLSTQADLLSRHLGRDFWRELTRDFRGEP